MGSSQRRQAGRPAAEATESRVHSEVVRRGIACLGGCVAAVLLSAGGAHAAGWSIEATPGPKGATATRLSGVSCTSASACTAVGGYTSGTGAGGTLAEHWNGRKWKMQKVPSPAGAALSDLGTVSCTSDTMCIAVGSYTTNVIGAVGPISPLAERWNGSKWTIHSPPVPPAGTTYNLSSVSCTSKRACIAVGYYTSPTGAGALAALWDGVHWTIQTTPKPDGATSSFLSGVSCTSATACTAVGSYNTVKGDSGTLAESWDGTNWTIQTTPNPVDANDTGLSAVSCTSAAACISLGTYASPAAQTGGTVAEGWDGTSWTIQTPPDSIASTTGTPLGVSCASAVCTAVGSYANSAGIAATLAERWDGRNWTVQGTPNPAGATSNYLSAVSCPSAAACTAVGSYAPGSGKSVMLAERYSDSPRWTRRARPTRRQPR